ncbi:MAG TPA: hypothetical protein VHZ26_20435 [Caulobacteraceae bacterium]|jgi:hypothetical protein|nr:hypothetical protein [Caulobacteraceae bacterium]
MRTVSLACIAALVAASAAGPASAAKPAFHPARTPAEQTLARILKLDGDKPGAVDPTVAATGRRPRTTPPPGAAYLAYLTPPLAAAILGAEARQVKANCGGVYKSGEECGMDADPIICAQDTPDSYLFRTVQTGPGLAVVEAAWPPDKGAQPTNSGAYRLKLTGAAWKIDAISCSGGDAYNWAAR